MRKYEVCCVFRAEDEVYGRGKETVKNELTQLGAALTAEDDLGARSLAYPLKKEIRGHYHVFHVDMAPEKARLIENALRLKAEILKTLVVVKGS
jgi:small subunit ribosomal protein S6